VIEHGTCRRHYCFAINGNCYINAKKKINSDRGMSDGSQILILSVSGPRPRP
jgi:hypothetical protein